MLNLMPNNVLLLVIQVVIAVIAFTVWLRFLQPKVFEFMKKNSSISKQQIKFTKAVINLGYVVWIISYILFNTSSIQPKLVLDVATKQYVPTVGETIIERTNELTTSKDRWKSFEEARKEMYQEQETNIQQ